jgi:hypothetical protein
MKGDPDLKAWPVFAILVIQVILFLAHWFVYSTFIAFWPGISPAAAADLRVAMLVLAFSFVTASLLSFRFSNVAVRLFYWAAAVWLGFLNFFFWASVFLFGWRGFARISHLAANPPQSARRSRPRFTRSLRSPEYTVSSTPASFASAASKCSIPDLPAAWRGRRACC